MVHCGICYEPFEEPVSVPCGHVFCAGCLAKTFEGLDTYEVPCPTCRLVFPSINIDPHLVPKKLRDYVTPCIRRLYLDEETPDVSQTELVRSLEAQLQAERQHSAELQQERDAARAERDSLYRVINVYKEKEKEHEAKDRRQKFQVANQVDELMHDNHRLQTRLEEAQTLLATMGLDRRTPPPSAPRPAPSTPRSSTNTLSSRPFMFATPSTPRTLSFAQAPLSPLRGGLAVAREDLQARIRIASPSKAQQQQQPQQLQLGTKRLREPQDDIDMAASSDGDKDDDDDTITPGSSRQIQRTPGLQGRSVRRKYGLQT
ncbi:hypothetical protein M408DRAFT_325602 [Serendipita vermifera MAFF 305830]|uniref:RING-type E3 ubiquitin transferase n=1 Tax=Serendipita vermifera MAFF 305830 TaxID=933852 RepID=A0A0C3BRQ3_SERVB|nr:hypothetical protein M408DRAFT_325602 [Serendipita vermifera MAFF 305830]